MLFISKKADTKIDILLISILLGLVFLLVFGDYIIGGVLSAKHTVGACETYGGVCSNMISEVKGDNSQDGFATCAAADDFIGKDKYRYVGKKDCGDYQCCLVNR